MAGFLDLRLDIVFFLHGTALALIASAAWGLARLEKRPHCWNWLALFASAQAAFVWLRIAAHDGFRSSALNTISPLLYLASCLCLLQFARKKLPKLRKSALAPGIFILPALVVAAGAVITESELSVWLYPTFGVLAGVLGGCAFFVHSRVFSNPQAKRRLRLGGVALASYLLVIGATTHSCLDLCAGLADAAASTTSFANSWVTGAQLVSAALAGLLFWFVGQHYCQWHRTGLLEHPHPRLWPQRRGAQLAGFVLILAVACIAAETAAKRQDASMRRNVLGHARLIAAAVDLADVAQLKWNETDLGNPAYLKLKQLMRSLAQANSDLRFVMLTGFHEGKAFFLVDSEAPDSKDYSPPGQPYEEAAREYLNAVETRQPFAIGPLYDRWGTWVSASVPLGEFGPDRRWVTADIDVNAAQWAVPIRQARLPVVFFALLVTLLLITFAHTRDRIHETVAQLSASEQRNSSLVEGSPNCVQMFNAAGHCLSLNQNGVRALGLPREEILGRPFAEIWPPSGRTVVQNAVDRTLKGTATLFEAEYVRPDGKTIFWRTALTPVRDPHGHVGSFVGISVDITDLKSSEKALLAAKEAAETATKAKSEFLAVMSHEIRTPLGGVIGMLNVLRKHPQTPEQQLYTELAHDNAENLLQILDDILDAAKVEAGKLTLESIPFVPRKEFGRVLEPMRVRAEAKGLRLTWDIAPSVSAVLVADPTRLRQVLANFLSNALKFTEEGSITAHIAGEERADGRVNLSIAVSDTGIGIPTDRQARLFTQFEQADSSTNRRYGGTGLGLSIVKSLAEIMEGEVSIKSVPGAGTTFIFAAPVGKDSAGALDATSDHVEHDPAKLPRHRARLHVLCVEDDSTNQVAAEFVLKEMGHTVEFVENGKQAVDWLSANRAAVVLMDNRMPVMDGFQATQYIRDPASSVIDHRVYIIANTANAGSGYRERCLAAGMNDYLTKPLREAELHAALDNAIAYREQHGLPLPPMPPETPPRDFKKIVAAAPVSETASLSEAELLAILEEDAARPKHPGPGSGFSAEAMQRITGQYLQETPLRLAELHAALGARDAATLARAAHSLKSTSRYVHADGLSELGAEMERLADAGQFADFPQMIDLAEKEFGEVRERLEPSVYSSQS